MKKITKVQYYGAAIQCSIAGSSDFSLQAVTNNCMCITCISFIRWFLQQQCSGKRKFLPAIKHALENETEIKHNIGRLVILCKFFSFCFSL